MGAGGGRVVSGGEMMGWMGVMGMGGKELVRG